LFGHAARMGRWVLRTKVWSEKLLRSDDLETIRRLEYDIKTDFNSVWLRGLHNLIRVEVK
jgi:hypothetical protein